MQGERRVALGTGRQMRRERRLEAVDEARRDEVGGFFGLADPAA